MKLIIKRMASIVCILAVLLVCLEGLQYLLVDDTSSYTRITMHELYNAEENIDVLFVGSSHVYRSLIPEIADGMLDKHTFNAGTSSQGMDGSLAMIKEAIAYHDIEQIYLEVYYGIAMGKEYKERTEMTSIYIITDYMRPSLRKVNYLLQASSKDYYVNGFVPARRNWEKIFDWEYVSELLAKKNAETYMNYEWGSSDEQIEYYVDRGFVASEESLANDGYWNESACKLINVDGISEDWKNSLDEIVDLCKKHDIELTLFAAPMPDMTLIGKENYDDYSMLIGNIAENYGINYYDFNLCKAVYFDTGNMAYFQDAGHLNLLGAQEFTKIFSGFFAGDISADNLFYNSYEEKLLAMAPRIYGVGGPKADEEDVSQVKILSNRDEGMEYQVILVSEDEAEQVIKDFSDVKEFEVPMNEPGVLKIEARYVGEVENVQEIEVEIRQ